MDRRVRPPAQPPADVQVTGMTPTSGRLSGGSVVTIAGANFGPTAEVYFAGTRVTPSAVGPAAITFTVPLRTAQTGFGSAGPAPVAVVTQGRYRARAELHALSQRARHGRQPDLGREQHVRRRRQGACQRPAVLSAGREDRCSRPRRSSVSTRS